MRRTLAIVLLSMAVSVVHADDDIYVGIAGARSNFHNLFSYAEELGMTADRDDDVLKIFGGYKLTSHIAAELGYFKGATFDRRFQDFAGSYTATVDLSAFGLNVVAHWPVGRQLELFGKAGFGLWKMDTVAEFVAPSMMTTSHGYDHGNGVVYGLGANFRITDRLKLRGEYDVIEIIADLELRTYSIGAAWSF